MNHDINETVKEIKRSFRLLMNGVASQSMREKGASYFVNWGCSLGKIILKIQLVENKEVTLLVELNW